MPATGLSQSCRWRAQSPGPRMAVRIVPLRRLAGCKMWRVADRVSTVSVRIRRVAPQWAASIVSSQTQELTS